MILPSKSTTTHVETNFDDTGRAEAEAFLSEIEGDGAKAGEVFAEVAAKAESANTGAGELAGRVKALEDRLSAVLVARCDKTTGSGNETFSPVGSPIPGAVYSWSVSMRQAGTLRYTVTAPPDVSGTLYLSQPDGPVLRYDFTGAATVVVQQDSSNSARVQTSTAGVPVTLTIEKLA